MCKNMVVLAATTLELQATGHLMTVYKLVRCPLCVPTTIKSYMSPALYNSCIFNL